MFIPEIEKKSIEEIKAFQEQKLQELLGYLNNYSAYYRELFKREKIEIESIKKLEDLQQIPTTSKQDLQERNDDFICVSPDEIIDYACTSGTMGLPVTVAMTENDLQRLAYNEYLSLLCANGSKEDIYQLMTTIDKQFMAGLAYFMGVRKLGAGIVRAGVGIPELQWRSIKRHSVTKLITVPSFLVKLLEYAEDNNIDYQGSTVTSAVCIGEPLRNQDFTLNTLGKSIIDQWDIELYSTYASTEMATAFTECSERKGGHHHPELIITEFLDEQGNPVPEGEIGEVTITTLGVEGMPLLRFRTGDMCRHFIAPCKCGRQTFRIAPVIGRKNQMIKYKGTTLYPTSIYDVLDKFIPLLEYVVEVSSNKDGMDEIMIRIAAENSERLTPQLEERLRASLRVLPKLSFDSLADIKALKFPPTSRKAIKFIDNRKQFNDF